MVGIQIISLVNSDELWCLCYQYTTWLISHLINRLLVTAPIFNWYKHKKISYTIPFSDIAIWRCTIYIINSKQEEKSLEPHTNIYICTFLPTLDPSFFPKSVDLFFMGYSNSTKVIIYFTLRPVASRELFVAELMNMILNYTPINTCLLLPSCSNNIPLESNNQAIHNLTQTFVLLNLL